MKHETEINEMINTAFPKQCWMTDEEHQEIIEETFKQMGINKEKLSNDIEIGVKNGHTVKQQINLLKSNILLLQLTELRINRYKDYDNRR